MSKTKGNKLVPALRFPEFRGDSNWEQKKLFELVDIKGRIGYRGYTIQDIVKKGEGAVTLGPSNIDENGILNFDNSTYISWSKFEESPEIMLEEGYTVLVKTASVGKTALVKELPEKTTINPQFVVLKPFAIHPIFLSLTISHSNTQKQIKANIGAGAIPNLSQESISKFIIFTPPDKNQKEQKKIADCLSSLDDLITAENKKLKALKSHKKGLLQQIFPAEGEQIPRVRFKKVSSKNWNEKQLKDVCQMQAGKFVSASDIDEVKNNYNFPCYGGNGLRGFTKSFTHSGEYSLIGRQGALCGNITLAKGKFHATEHAVVVTPEKGLSTVWLFYMLNYLNLNQYATGQAQPGLSVDNLEKVKIHVPESKKEQEKIAEFLLSLDKLINEQNKRVESLKLHKKGLMQQLFPKVNNV